MAASCTMCCAISRQHEVTLIKHSRRQPGRMAVMALLASLFTGLAGPVLAATLVVSDPDNRRVVFIDTLSGAQQGLATGGAGPRAVALRPGGKTGVVADYGAVRIAGKSIQVLDVTRGALRKTISIAPYQRPSAIQFLPDGRRALIAVQGDKSLLMIDVGAGRIEASFGAPADSVRQFALSEDGKSVYLGDPAGGKISKIDLTSGRETAVSTTQASAQKMAVSTNGGRLWVVDRNEDLVKVMDGRDLHLIAGLDTGNLPMGLTLTPNGRYALVSNALSADVVVYDTASLEQSQIISTRSVPSTSPMPRSESENLSDVKRMSQISIPVAISAAPDGISAFVMNNFSGEIIQFDIFTGAPLHIFQGIPRPGGMAYSPVTMGGAK